MGYVPAGISAGDGVAVSLGAARSTCSRRGVYQPCRGDASGTHHLGGGLHHHLSIHHAPDARIVDRQSITTAAFACRADRRAAVDVLAVGGAPCPLCDARLLVVYGLYRQLISSRSGMEAPIRALVMA